MVNHLQALLKTAEIAPMASTKSSFNLPGHRQAEVVELWLQNNILQAWSPPRYKQMLTNATWYGLPQNIASQLLNYACVGVLAKRNFTTKISNPQVVSTRINYF